MENRIVVVGAHAGDAELMAGGIMASATDLGYKATIVHMTLGEKGHPSLPPEEYGRQKRREAEAAAKALGADVVFMGYRDGELRTDEEAKTELAKVLRRLSPRVVVTHWRGSLHKDHVATHIITGDAVFYHAIKWFGLGGSPSGCRIFYAENWEDSAGYKTDIYIDISSVAERWREAMEQYAFARGETGFPYVDYYLSLARLRGIEVGVGYAQTLMLPWYARKRRASVEELFI